MLAQLCDLPFSGGSIGPVLVAGALAVLAGAVILVLQRRARRSVTPLALIALLVPAAVLMAFATGSADADAGAISRSMTTGQDPACGGTSEWSSTTSFTTTSGPAWSIVKVLSSIATRPTTVAPTTPAPTRPPTTPAPTVPETTPPTTVEPTTTSTTSTSTSTSTTTTTSPTTTTATTITTSTTIAPSTTAGVTTTSYEDTGTDDTTQTNFASNLDDHTGDAELQTAGGSPESSVVVDDAV